LFFFLRLLRGQVHFLWDSSSEALLYIDGEPLQAFNAADGADKKAEFVLRKKGQVKVFFHLSSLFFFRLLLSFSHSILDYKLMLVLALY
jgi:hypothetical protein